MNGATFMISFPSSGKSLNLQTIKLDSTIGSRLPLRAAQTK